MFSCILPRYVLTQLQRETPVSANPVTPWARWHPWEENSGTTTGREPGRAAAKFPVWLREHLQLNLGKA